MNINSGCCCCAARTCLIIWTSIIIVFGTLQPFFLDFDTSPGSAAVVLVITLMGIGNASFILFAGYKMDQKLLRIAFWVQIANMGISAVLQLINAIFLNRSGQEIGIGYRFIAAFVMVLFFSIIQGLLAWTIKKTLKEAEEAGTPEQGAYVPGMPNM